MYTAFYGLREKPFALSPDPRFLYLAGSHREALAHLLYGIEQGEGFISITGEVGTGKTTLCRTLLERLEGNLEVAFLFNPSRTGLELLQSICAEFGLPAEGLARRSLMAQLNTFLVEQKRIGRRVLLIIDEAQTLSETTLEQVRLLSNLETSREKLIQILLLGQPELDRKLDERGLRQLRQRISVRWKLEPLGAQETRAYVRHRLAIAAGEPKDLFSESALREVHRRTGGIPRLVNQLCDRALLAGYASRVAQIGPRLVRAAAREIPDAQLSGDDGSRPSKRPSISRPWLFFAASVGLVGVSLFAGLQVGRLGLTESLRASGLKPAEFRTDGEGRSLNRTRPSDSGSHSESDPPPVGANAPATPGRAAPQGAGSAGALASADASPLVELIGYVPEDVRAGLRLTPGQLGRLPDSHSQTAADASITGTPALSTMVASETTLAIPARPSSAETALARGLLPRLLASRNTQVAISDAQSALLDRFGRQAPRLAARPRGANDLRRMFESRGLAATPFEGGSIELLRRLDHPVVLPLASDASDPSARLTLNADSDQPDAPNNNTRWVAITGFSRDRARVAGLVPDQIVTIEIDELESFWLETGIIVWERFESIPHLLAEKDEGAGVMWLQRSLAELEFFDGAVTGLFDDTTAAALRRFQSDRGLVADGVAGPLSQIALYARLARYPVPRLSQYTPSPSEVPTPTVTRNSLDGATEATTHSTNAPTSSSVVRDLSPVHSGDRG